MFEDEEYDEITHLESFMVGDQQDWENNQFLGNDGKEPFLQYFSLDSFDHELLYAPDNIRDDLKHGYDHITGFILEKLHFQMELKLKRGIVAKKNVLPKFEEVEKHIHSLDRDCSLKVSNYIPQLLTRMSEDPDMHYFGHYNWYYTGGTLQCVNNNGCHSLLFIEKADKDHLCVAPLDLDSSQHLDSSKISKIVPCDGQEIFQVVGSENSNFIGTRQKHDCTVFSVANNEGNNVILECFKISSEEPFTGFDISSVYSELCTLSTKGALTYWDLNCENLPVNVRCLSDNPRHDKWHSMWYSHSSPSEVVVACRKFLQWYDRRSNNRGNTVDLRRISGREIDEEISVHFQSKCNSNGIYIGTNVSLLLMDVRMLEAPVHNWCHRLLLPPLYSSVTSFPECREIACIGNHYPGDVVLAFSTPDISYPLVEVPSRMDSLVAMQSEGKCLHPSLQPRLAPGISGLTFISNPDNLNTKILTQSRTSDIFAQALFKSNSNVSPDLKDFNILKTEKEKLNASERWDMSKLYNSLSSSNNESVNVNTKVRLPPQSNQKWQRSLKDIKSYKDVLSSIIVDEWDSLYQAEQEETKHIERVSAWLDSCNYNSD